ncbi:MAG: hypothetical protein ACJ8G7_06675 [Rhizobacter sp.]
MPQTREHAAVLAALGVDVGVVAVTKADLADPDRALAEVAALLPGAEAVPVSARTGEGVDALQDALQRAAGRVRGRAGGQRGGRCAHRGQPLNAPPTRCGRGSTPRSRRAPARHARGSPR